MRSDRYRNAALARRTVSSDCRTVGFSLAQSIQGHNSSADSNLAALNSGPSPGIGERISSLSVSKESGKSLRIGECV